jgi:hypothetical protein
MTIDEVVLSCRLKQLKGEALLLDVSIAKRQADFEKDFAQMERDKVRLDRLMDKIEAEEQALYWVRLSELLHTPCWRYRVAS